MRLITIQQASEELKISVGSLYGTNKNRYQNFRHRTEDKTIMFDIDGYLKMQGDKESLTEKTMLFVEYLNKVEGMGYTDISTLTGQNKQQMASLTFGFKYAYKLIKAFATQRPFHLKRFDEYYGWDHVQLQTKKILG